MLKVEDIDQVRCLSLLSASASCPQAQDVWCLRLRDLQNVERRPGPHRPLQRQGPLRAAARLVARVRRGLLVQHRGERPRRLPRRSGALACSSLESSIWVRGSSPRTMARLNRNTHF